MPWHWKDEEPLWMTAGLHRAPPDFSYEDEVRARQQVPGFEQSLYEEGPQAWGGEPYFPHEMAANEYTRGVLGGLGAAANIPTQSQIDDAGWRGPEMDPRTSQAISIDPRTRAAAPPAPSQAMSIEPSYARTADTYGIAQPPDFLGGRYPGLEGPLPEEMSAGLLGNILNRIRTIDSSGIPLGSRGGASSMPRGGFSEAPIPRWSDRESFRGGFFPDVGGDLSGLGRKVGEYVSGLVPGGTSPRGPLPTGPEAETRAKGTRLPQESAIVKALEQGFEFTGELKAGRPLYRSLHKERGKGIAAGLQSEHPLLRHQKDFEFAGELDASGSPLYFSRFKERATTAKRRAVEGGKSAAVAREKRLLEHQSKIQADLNAEKERLALLRKKLQERADYLKRFRERYSLMYDPMRGYE